MKKIGIIAHFGFGHNLLNGQTIKAKILLESMQHHLGESEVDTVDTHGGIKRIPLMIINSIRLFVKCKNVILLPANKGIRLFLPLAVFCSKLFDRKVFHIVIGGWLPQFLGKHWILRHIEMYCDGVYVETIAMKDALEKQKLNNVAVLPNCKVLKKINSDELHLENSEPFHVCTFSRVMKEKGIEEAIEAVKIANRKLGRTAFLLHIYGQIWKNYESDFDKLKDAFPPFIKYKGVIPYNKSVEIISKYTALLFPTYYEGEGVAGTLIDAMAAGVPAIASDWKYNKEVIVPGKTGVLINECTADKLAEWLIEIAQNPKKWNDMKIACIEEAEKYDADLVYKKLLKDMEI